MNRVPNEVAQIRDTGEPEIQALFVTASMNELQSMIDQGYKIASCFSHAKGAIFIMVREAGNIKIK
jgi:hypothetical protein